MRRSGGTKEIDETDRLLCGLLAADPRRSNRSLAEAVDLTDETVAARLRRLRDDAVLATTLVVDSGVAGYGAEAIVRVTVNGGPFRDVIGELAADPRVLAITEVSGCCDGVVNVVAQEVSELRELVTGSLRAVPGVSGVTVDVVTGDVKTPEAIVTLPIPDWDPDDLPAPRVEIDELDKNLMRELIRDGHRSNTEIARRLDVSDATVRRRVQQLEGSGLVRVVAAVDPVVTGDLSAVAFAFLEVSGVDDALDTELRARSDVLAAYSTLGSADAVLLIGTSNDNTLTAMASHELAALSGVRGATMAFGSEVLHHRGYLTRLAPRNGGTGSPRPTR